jgi:predicted RNase H-like HicB family nuclease
MKTRELNLPDCKSCCGSGEAIEKALTKAEGGK